MNNEQLNEVKNGLCVISDSLKEKVQISNELIINMKQNLESLQSSLIEVNKFIEVLNENVKDDNNIFFVGSGKQDNKNKLKEQNKIKSDLEDRIKEIEETILQEDNKIKYFISIADSINDYNNKLENIQNNDRKEKLLNSLHLCQNFSKIDHERCYIELSKVIEEVEGWEEN